MRVILQNEAAECSLACLLMIADCHGLKLDLASARRRFNISSKGSDLRQLMSQAASLGLSARAVRLDLDELAQLETPCILHWDLNHFVVLNKVQRGKVIIVDPAVGLRRLTVKELSTHFSGVALELSPNANFVPKDLKPRIALSQLTGRVLGLKKAVFQILSAALVLELFAIAAPLFNQMVIDDGVTSGDRELLSVLLIGFALLLIVQTALALARSWMIMILGQTLSLQWTGNLFSHLIKLSPGFFEKRHLGDIVSRFSALGSIQRTLTTSVMEAILDGIMALAALVMMFIYSPPLAAVTCAAVAAYAALRVAFFRPFRNAAAERLIVSARENSHFLETLRAITPLKLFGREEERRARWQNLMVDVQNRDVRTAKMNITFSTSNTFIFGFENLLVFWLGARMVIESMTSTTTSIFTLGMLFAYISYKGQFTGRVSALINYGIEVRMMGLHVERLSDIALTPPEHDVENIQASESSLDNLEPSLELRNVSFRYGDAEPWILKDASFLVPAGQSVALTGASGAGKTTLLKILLGLLQPTDGQVLYGGIPLRQLGLPNVRRQMGTVMQDDSLLTGSLAENISFFDLTPDTSFIEDCASHAQLHTDIMKMPMAYQTLVGDLGNGLSGGQKQRLLLARALYKKPRVLALDEATSHLDLRNERAVTASLQGLKLTRLIIAHRPETIAGSERVVELSDARVVDVRSDLQKTVSDCGIPLTVNELRPGGLAIELG